MTEIKRVFLNRKFVIFFLALIVANGLLFYQKQVAVCFYEEYDAEYLKHCTEKTEQIIDQYSGCPVAEALEKTEEKISALILEMSSDSYRDDTKTLEIDLAAYGQVAGSLTYLTDYSKKYQEIKKNADNMLESVGTDKSSFAYKNIIKTKKDFADIQSENIKLDNEELIGAVMTYEYSDLMTASIVMFAVLILYDEKRKGVWTYVYTLPKGRRRLGASKIAAVFVTCAVATIIFNMENIIVGSRYFGGLGDLTRAAQSNSYFENMSINISMGGILFLIYLIRILAFFIIGMTFWLILSNMRSQILASGIFGAVMWAEYLCYENISSVGAYTGIKYINIFSIVKSNDMLSVYKNMNVFGNAVSRNIIMIIFMVLLVSAVTALSIILAGRHPFSQGKRAGGKIRLLSGKFQTVSLLFNNIYKEMIQKRMWIFIILVFAAAYFINRPQTIYLDYYNTLYVKYMDMLEGDITQEKNDFLLSEKKNWQEKYEEYRVKIESYENGEIDLTSNEYEKLLSKAHNMEIAVNVTGDILSETERMTELHKDGHKASYVNNIPYEHLYGENGSAARKRDTLLFMIFLIFVLATVYSYDNQSNMNKLIRCTEKGRSRDFIVKTGMAYFYILTGWGALFLNRLFMIKTEFGMEGADYGIGSIKSVAEGMTGIRLVLVNLDIWQYMASRFILETVVFLIAGIVILCISKKSKNNVTSMCVSMMLLFLFAIIFD